MRLRKIAVAAVAVAGILASSISAAQQKSFNVSIWLPPTHPLTKYGYADWFKGLEKESHGSLKARLFTGTSLLSPQDHLSGARDGIAQVAWINGAYHPSDLPVNNTVFQLAFRYTNYFVGAFATTEFNMLDHEANAEWLRNGVVYLSGYSTPPYRLICTSPSNTIAEIKGKKLRTFGVILPEWAKSVGAVPVSVASSETYTGLEKGQLDCGLNAIDDLRSRSYWDVAKDATMVDLGVFWTSNVANADFWRSLTTAQRKAFLHATAEAVVNSGIGYEHDVKEIMSQARAKNEKFLKPDAGLKASVDSYKKRVDEVAVAAGHKFNVKDPEDVVARFEKIARKWEGLLHGVSPTDKEKMTVLLEREVYDKVDPANYGMK